jgi:hypothetical protein
MPSSLALSFPIYKICKVDISNKITHLFVFYNFTSIGISIEKLQSLFISNPNNESFLNYFSIKELEQIQNNNINVIFVDDYIHIDDTISSLKFKIIDALNKLNNYEDTTVEDIYMFYMKQTPIDLVTLYHNLTYNQLIQLNFNRLQQHLLNLYLNTQLSLKQYEFKIQQKDVYTFDDLINMNLNTIFESENLLTSYSLGQKINISNFDYTITSNPFIIKQYDKIIKDVDNIVNTHNASLLLDYGDIFQNTIYVCVASDVLEYNKSNPVLISTSLKIYYPSLYALNIKDISSYESEHVNLIQTTQMGISDAKKYNNSIDMFYNIYQTQKPSKLFKLLDEKSGIINFKIEIIPKTRLNIPLDVIFKIINSTKQYPLIKYRAKQQQDSIYRLYSPSISTKGIKIPMLSKSHINKIDRNIGKSRTVSVYIVYKYQGYEIDLCCEITTNCVLTFYTVFDTKIPIKYDIEMINNMISECLDPLTSNIQLKIEQSGIKFQKFNSIVDENVNLLNMKYVYVYNISKNYDLTKYTKCLASIFVLENTNSKIEAVLRLKRVSYFQELGSHESFIIEKIKQGISKRNIIEDFKKNFDKRDDEYINKLIENIHEKMEEFSNAKIRKWLTTINPGFKTIVNVDKNTSEMFISIDSINNFNYLSTTDIYIDTFVRLTQDIGSSSIPIDYIDKICINASKLKGSHLKDISNNNTTSLTISNLKKLTNSESQSQQTTNNYTDEINQQKQTTDLSLSNDSNTDETSFTKSNNETTKESEESEESMYDAYNTFDNFDDYDDYDDIVDYGNMDDFGDLNMENMNYFEDMYGGGYEDIYEDEYENMFGGDNYSMGTKNLDETENTIRDITGMSLKYPNLITMRLKPKMPNLFISTRDEKGKKKELYSRMCPYALNDKRQPVILTKEEKDDMVKRQGLDENSDFVKYNTDPKDPSKTFYFSCPRYWCLLTNKAVTEQEILDGKCGKKVNDIKELLVPPNANEVPEGKTVLEMLTGTGKMYPGFHKETTPDGMCIPCCFKDWKTPVRQVRRDKCQNTPYDQTKNNEIKDSQGNTKSKSKKNEEDEEDEEDVMLDIDKKIKVNSDAYIKTGDKYGPDLDIGRLGYLPETLDVFFENISKEYKKKNVKGTVDLNHLHLFRMGVESHPTQSFLGCMSNALFYNETFIDDSNHYSKSNTKRTMSEATKKRLTKPLIQKYFPNSKTKIATIDQLKQLIMRSLSLDNFLKYQNGNLFEAFKIPVNQMSSSLLSIYNKINLDDYRREEIVNSQPLTEKRVGFLKLLIIAYGKFKDYLFSNSETIDYTYLWDLMTMPNEYLFKDGINLVILQMLNEDVTNNVSVVCPTNYYSKNVFDLKKKTLVLIQQEEYFHPIYAYYNTTNGSKKKEKLMKFFNEGDVNLPLNLKGFFDYILRPIMNSKCKASLDIPNKYMFKIPKLLNDVILDLHKMKYEIIEQIMNFNGKVIGLKVKSESGLTGFVGCYPSSKEEEIKINYVDGQIWKNYKETYDFLEEYYKNLNKIQNNNQNKIQNNNQNIENEYNDHKFENIKKEYKDNFYKIVDSMMVIGFLTDINQFIPLNKPEPLSQTNDDLKIIENSNPMDVDTEGLLSNEKDEVRITFMKKIQMEMAYYNAFRNTLRLLLNDLNNSVFRSELIAECKKRFLPYKEQHKNVVRLTHNTAKDYIVFVSNKDGYNYNDIKLLDIQTCLNTFEEQSNINVCRSIPIKQTNKQNTKINRVLILPKENLLTGEDNEKYYYQKIADEFIRFNRIKSFIFNPQNYMPLGDVKYSVNENEMLIMHDILKQPNFFDKMVVEPKTKYGTNKIHDMVNTNKFLDYSKKYDQHELLNQTNNDAIINQNYLEHVKGQFNTNKYGNDHFDEEDEYYFDSGTYQTETIDVTNNNNNNIDNNVIKDSDIHKDNHDNKTTPHTISRTEEYLKNEEINMNNDSNISPNTSKTANVNSIRYDDHVSINDNNINENNGLKTINMKNTIINNGDESKNNDIINKSHKYNYGIDDDDDNDDNNNEQTIFNTQNKDDYIPPFECTRQKLDKIKSLYWRATFPKKYKELLYSGGTSCMFQMLSDVLEAYSNKKSINELKEMLIEGYREITKDYNDTKMFNKLLDMLTDEGQDCKNYTKEMLEEKVMSISFVPVNFDLWVLSERLKLNIIMISSKFMAETLYNSKVCVNYKDNNNPNKYIFVMCSAMYKRNRTKQPKYSLITSDTGKILMDLKEVNMNDGDELISMAIKNYVNVERFLRDIFK